MCTERRSAGAVRGLLTIRPAPRRWPFALRVAACTAVLVAIGVAVGDVGAGLIATLGVFTADYGSRRPYANRAVHTGIIAVTLAIAVTIGVWSAQTGWVAVVSVSAVAVVAVWLCMGLAVGPPGAFGFVLACAAGVGVSASHRPAWQVGLLVLVGGAIGWIAAMTPGLIDPRGPEKSAVTAAGQAVAAYVEAADTAESAAARRVAATALVYAWAVLIDYQPRMVRPSPLLRRLRRANHALHVLFTDALGAASRAEPIPAGTAALARAIGAGEADPAVVAERDEVRSLLRRPTTAAQLLRAIGPDAPARRVMVRVAIATPLAGACAASLGISHAYWAMAAAVLVLHQGDHRLATFQRGAARVIGTGAGLCLAALILSARPAGLWLVSVLALLQFAIKMVNVRNYALATVFTTATGLTIGTATHRVDIENLLIDRALDTVIGCGIGVMVYLIALHLQESDRVIDSLDRTMRHVHSVTVFLANGDASSLAARRARRDLQESIFDLHAADDSARKGPPRHRESAARLSRIVAAVEQLAFATIAASWAAEQGNNPVLDCNDAQAYLAMLGDLSNAIETADPQLITRDVPAFVATELRDLARALGNPARHD
ncbi:MAG: FUSC family protein [Mycobacterium sp.]|nr:FUSC family protein [Mycobacterium sp.]